MSRVIPWNIAYTLSTAQQPQVQYVQQDVNGQPKGSPVPGSWNRVYNNSNFDITSPIKAT